MAGLNGYIERFDVGEKSVEFLALTDAGFV